MRSGAPFIVKVGGALLDDSAALEGVVAGIAGLHARRAGSVAVVHGGGAAVDRHLGRLGFSTQKRAGIRITPADQMVEIASILGGAVNQRLVGALLAHGASAVGLTLGDGMTAVAAPIEGLDFDPGRVGMVSSGDETLLRTLLEAGFLPVLSSVGIDAEGGLLNVNADDAAAAIASIVGASALVFLTDVPGVLDADGSLIECLDAAAIESLILEGVIRDGMIPKVRGALESAQRCGIGVIIASWRDPRALARLAEGDPCGTRIVASLADPLPAPRGR
ncbi:MAG: acetylglutamate kinase [Phycisphaerales bacterium]|nr:acetylglutamate kinase [Phycisphaerales bacterium]